MLFKSLKHLQFTKALTGKSSRCLSIWENVGTGMVDPIFAFRDRFNADPHPSKHFLVVGVYRDEGGLPFVFPIVRKIEKLILSQKLDKEYPPIPGQKDMLDGAKKFVFGKDCKYLDRICSIQGQSGLGSFRLILEYIHRLLGPDRDIYTPLTGYPVTDSMIETMNFNITHYPNYNFQTKGFELTKMLESLEKAKEGSVIQMQPCAMNPTGTDPSYEEWKIIMEVIKRKQLVAFFDFAYQGFGSGDVDLDAAPVRLFADNHVEVIVAQSFSKNAGLYGERCGAAHFVCDNQLLAENMLSHAMKIKRNIYGFDNLHGTRIMTHLLNNEEFHAEWMEELRSITHRIIKMRQTLKYELEAINTPGNWDHIVNSKGLFALTCLNVEQCEMLMSKHHIYMVPVAGRVNMSCINHHNVKVVAEGIKDVMELIPNKELGTAQFKRIS